MHQNNESAGRAQFEYLIADGKISRFTDIFQFISVPALAAITSIDPVRIDEIAKTPMTICITEMYRIADALHIKIPHLIELLQPNGFGKSSKK